MFQVFPTSVFCFFYSSTCCCRYLRNVVAVHEPGLLPSSCDMLCTCVNEWSTVAHLQGASTWAGHEVGRQAGRPSNKMVGSNENDQDMMKCCGQTSQHGVVEVTNGVPS